MPAMVLVFAEHFAGQCCYFGSCHILSSGCWLCHRGHCQSEVIIHWQVGRSSWLWCQVYEPIDCCRLFDCASRGHFVVHVQEQSERDRLERHSVDGNGCQWTGGDQGCSA